jgi:hypothetical protein
MAFSFFDGSPLNFLKLRQDHREPCQSDLFLKESKSRTSLERVMKSPTDMLATDLRRMAGVIPVGWRAVIVMAVTVIVFPVLITVFILDALTYDMPGIRNPVRKTFDWLSRWILHTPQHTRTVRRPARHFSKPAGQTT